MQFPFIIDNIRNALYFKRIMTTDRSLCPLCAWRGDCKKKFNKGSGIHCADFSRDLTVKDNELEEELKRQSKSKDAEKKSKKGLWPM
jgi:hypothetical protein